MRVFDDASCSIGNTPLVRLRKIGQGLKANVLGKVEGRNPSQSVKCRIGASMVWAAEKKGTLKPGGTIVESTSGNTGIALAFVAAARGYGLILTMPDSMSVERRQLLKAFGADVILTPGDKGMPGAIAEAEQIAGGNPDYCLPQQFSNPANPEIHRQTTGLEIWNDLEGQVDVFVAGVGTGGTITGVAQLFKKDKGKPVAIVAVEPAGSAVMSGGKPGFHKIQGLGPGFMPDVLDMDLVDHVEAVTDSEAMEMCRRLAREEGLLCGFSSGAALVAALRYAAQDQYEGKNIVVILADSGERYLSTTLFS